MYINFFNISIRVSALILFIFCSSHLFGQTETFRKDYSVNNLTRLELTDLNGLPLKQGGVYDISLNVLSTGTRTGANYLVWYDGKSSSWNLRLVSTAGMDSNHPQLEIVNNMINVFTLHENTYRVRAFVKFYDSGNIYTVPSMLGGSFQWQRRGQNISYSDGNVGVGTDNPSEKLSVNGNIRAKEIKVEATNWPDYVFANDYQLLPLTEIEKYIKKYQHLPDVPSATMVNSQGIDLGNMNKILLKKIEELTLYLLEANKELESLRQLESRIEVLENSLKKK